jgi:hypothetical protein
MSMEFDRAQTSADRLYVSIPEAGWMAAGLGRSASYAAAKRGQLPTLRIGRRLVVPLGLLRTTFGLDPEPSRLAARNAADGDDAAASQRQAS